MKSRVNLTKSLSKLEKNSLRFITRLSLQKLILVEVALVVTVLAGYIAARFVPRHAWLIYVQKNSTEIVARLKQDLNSAEEELKHLRAQYQTISRLVQRSNQTANLMELVLRTADKNGVKCEALTPVFSSKREEGEFVAVPVNVNLKGSFMNLVRVLRVIETDKDRANVITVVVTSNPKTYPLGNALLVIETYQPKQEKLQSLASLARRGQSGFK